MVMLTRTPIMLAQYHVDIISFINGPCRLFIFFNEEDHVDIMCTFFWGENVDIMYLTFFKNK